MPLIRPRDVVAEINELGRLYLIPDGPSATPLNETTIPRIRRILKLIQQIPPDLRPKDSDYRLLNEAVKASREALQNAEREQSQASLLYGKPEHEYENPLSTIRRMLAWTLSLRPKEVRRRLLELAAEHEKTTRDPLFQDYLALGSAIDANLTLDEIRRQMSILREEGHVQLTESQAWTISLTSSGWKALEELVESTDASEGLIFISCGQFTDEEKALGHSLADAVEDLTPYQGFFAENESSLEGLSRNIFGALNKCMGLVAVMHHRGLVKTPYGDHLRASVWIEQEIAIAAFLTQTVGRDLRVVLYLQEGIRLEGVRQQLTLNPVIFKDNEYVLKDFKEQLSNGLFQTATSVARSS